MRVHVGASELEVTEGDITKQRVDAIVNAANTTLLGGGGVDGAIHRAGGPAILEECRGLGGCQTGDAKITTGGRLPARYVIHTVGPVYSPTAAEQCAALLSSCYRRSLELAERHGVQSVAFPAISTGAYRYPIREAADVALQTVGEYLTGAEASSIRLVRFVLFGSHAYEIHKRALIRLAALW